MTEKKKWVRVTALLTAALVLFYMVITEIPESAFAQQSFNGIDTLISAHDETDPFTIVELVPDLSMAKLGYLVGGSEPFSISNNTIKNYTDSLAALTNPADRIAFNIKQATDLASIISTGNTTEVFPLSYSDYEESYIPMDGYSELRLAQQEVIVAGTTGYYMDAVGDGNGDYRYMASYSLVENGGYDQNVAYFGKDITDNRYYELSFQCITDMASFDGVAYELTAEYLGTKKAVGTIADVTNLYYASAFDAPFKKVTTENAGTIPETDYIFRAYFSKAENIEQDKNYYEVSDVVFDVGKEGTYGAVLDVIEPYVAVAGGGHFKEESSAYQYVGTGNGDSVLKKDSSKTLSDDVIINSIYYKGGFTNNELFKQYVFNQSGLLDEEDMDISIEVIAMTPGELNAYSGGMDMLYISNSSMLTTSFAKYDVAGNDLTTLLTYEIYQKVLNEDTYLPVMLDYGVLEDTSISGTNVYKLAKLFNAQDLNPDNVKLEEVSGAFSLTIGNFAAFSDSDHHYVNKNVYVIPADTASNCFISDFQKIFLDGTSASKDDFQSQADTAGFGDVAETIIEENLYREVENNASTGNQYELFDQKISKAITVEYIISYAAKREEYQNYTLEILDIEPCTINDNSKTAIENNIKNYLGITNNSLYKVNVTHMSSAEFISKVEDLCKYDMIYMGLKIDTLNKSNDRTVYNDSSMNGLVYTNIGDINYDWLAKGLLDTEYVSTSNHYSIYNTSGSRELRYQYDDLDCVRYSGNDFTDEKVTAIENFVKSGSPLLLADNFLTTGADGKTYVYDYQYDANGKQITSNGNGYIDNCSRVYDLIDGIKECANVMTEGSVSKSQTKKNILFQYITLGKPSLTVTTDAKETGQEYVKTDGAKVSMDFSIANFGSADANATFNCVIYADFNADGRYSDSTERIGANDFTITLNGIEQPVKSKTDEENNTYYYYELSPNSSDTQYHLEYQLASDFVGLIPIKIKVSQSSNDYRYDSEQMYFYKENVSNEKLEVHVLQILPTSGTNQFNMGRKGEYDGDLDENSPFYKYLHELENYDIIIDAMRASRYATEYKNNPSFLDNYDMLVIGFADCYNFLQTPNGSYGYNGKFLFNEEETIKAYQGIKEFIESGKSVLFTHDTTSYGSNPNLASGGDDWGLVLNQIMSQDVGLDRYGINESWLLKAGIKGLTKDGSTTYNVSDYQSLKTAYDKGILTKQSYTSGELFDLIVAEAEANNKDIAYVPNSNRTKLATEAQGRSSMTINGNSSQYTYKNVEGNPGGLPQTTKVELINEGQILVYPYNILDTITANNNIMTVANTHGQYFQIDMNEDQDEDGESDITVWLSLTNNTAYDAAKKDARNNYYIYTKGNVTYSGVGHSNLNYTGNDTEVQLYINTLVAAYNAGAQAPSVSVTDDGDTELNTIYVGMDSVINADGSVSDGVQIDKGSEKVYFTVQDTNISRGGTKRISVDYYLVYGDESKIPKGKDKSTLVNLGTTEKPVWAEKQDWSTYTPTGAVQDATDITSGVMYSVDVPYDIIPEDESKAVIYVAATTSLWRENSDPEKTDPSGKYTSYEEFFVQRVGLFDLD